MTQGDLPAPRLGRVVTESDTLKTVGQKVLDLLNKPLFGTKVIPRNAVVNPDLFAEDEFPIWCERCGYSLKQLSEGRCPECGLEFTRGRTLVIEYLTGPRAWRGRRLWFRRRSSATQRIGRIMCVAGLVPLAILVLASPIVDTLFPVGPTRQTRVSELLLRATDSVGRRVVVVLFFTIAVGSFLIYMAGAVVSAMPPRDLRRKRKRVLTAITDRPEGA